MSIYIQTQVDSCSECPHRFTTIEGEMCDELANVRGESGYLGPYASSKEWSDKIHPRCPYLEHTGNF